jgi:WD40 repeat protein
MDKQNNSETPKKSAGDDSRCFRQPYHLVRSNTLEKYDRFCRLLYSFKFLRDKIQHPEFGVQAMIEDYDLLDTPEAKRHSGRDPKTVKALRRIQDALQLCADRLAKEPTELASHLWDKLQCFSELPEINCLLQKVKQCQKERQAVWLRPLEPSLPRPGERLRRTLRGHGSPVNVVAVSSDGEQAVSGSEDGTLRVWDLKTGEASSTIEAHGKSVTAIAITPDNKQVISGSEDGKLKVWKLDKRWDSDKNKEIFTLQAPFTLYEEEEEYAITTLAITFTSEGKSSTIVLEAKLEANSRGSLWEQSSYKRPRVIRWDLEEKRKVLLEEFDADTITLIPDGTKAILWSVDHKSRLYTRHGGIWTYAYVDLKIKNLLPKNDNQKGFKICIGKVFESYKFDKVYEIDIEDNLDFKGKPASITRDLFDFKDKPAVIAIDPNKKQAIFTIMGKNLVVYNLENGGLFALTGHNEKVTAVAITFDGKHAVSGSKDGTLKIWSLETKQELSTEKRHTSLVNSITITPDGKKAISGSKDGTLKIWSLENLKGS